MTFRWLQPFLISLALLFAQQGALLHGMSHSLQDRSGPSQEQHLPGDKACDKCVAFAQIGGAVASGDPPFMAVASHFLPAFFVLLFTAVHITLGYSSRAPPVLL